MEIGAWSVITIKTSLYCFSISRHSVGKKQRKNVRWEMTDACECRHSNNCLYLLTDHAYTHMLSLECLSCCHL